MDEVVIAVRVDIGPDQRDHGPGDQKERIVGDITPDTIHPFSSPPSVACIGHSRRSGKAGDGGSGLSKRAAALRLGP
ncbi:MAG: hypothetical protein Kow0045_14450 [Albidovulum sp.]